MPAYDNLLTLELTDSDDYSILAVADIDMTEFYRECQKSLSLKSLPRTWVNLFSPFVSNKLMGKINIEASMLSVEDAEEDPVGEGRSMPNKDPALETPNFGRDFTELENNIIEIEEDYQSMRNKYRMYIAIFVCLIICITIPIVLASTL